MSSIVTALVPVLGNCIRKATWLMPKLSGLRHIGPSWYPHFMCSPLLRTAQKWPIPEEGCCPFSLGSQICAPVVQRQGGIHISFFTAASRKVMFWTSLAFLMWLTLHLHTICKLRLSCRSSFSLKPEKFSLFPQLPCQLAFGKVRVHEEEKDLPIISSLSAAQGANTCLMHYDSETCLQIFLIPASEFSVLICQFKENQKDLNEDYAPMQNVFGQYFRVKASSPRKHTSSPSFVLMKKYLSMIWWKEYWGLKGACSPKLDFL